MGHCCSCANAIKPSIFARGVRAKWRCRARPVPPGDEGHFDCITGKRIHSDVYELCETHNSNGECALYSTRYKVRHHYVVLVPRTIPIGSGFEEHYVDVWASTFYGQEKHYLFTMKLDHQQNFLMSGETPGGVQ